MEAHWISQKLQFVTESHMSRHCAIQSIVKWSWFLEFAERNSLRNPTPSNAELCHGLSSMGLNSDQISVAAPSGKKFLDARTKEVTVSKCCFLTFQPSGPMFLLKWVFINVSYNGHHCTSSKSLFLCFLKSLMSKPPHLIWTTNLFWDAWNISNPSFTRSCTSTGEISLFALIKLYHSKNKHQH